MRTIAYRVMALTEMLTACTGAISILVGEPEKALDQLELLLKMPYFLSPGWLKIDPNFDPLRSNPRFQLIAGRL